MQVNIPQAQSLQQPQGVHAGMSHGQNSLSRDSRRKIWGPHYRATTARLHIWNFAHGSYGIYLRLRGGCHGMTWGAYANSIMVKGNFDNQGPRFKPQNIRALDYCKHTHKKDLKLLETATPSLWGCKYRSAWEQLGTEGLSSILVCAQLTLTSH